MNKKKKILKYIVIYLGVNFFFLFSITTFEWKGNQALSWKEAISPPVFPIILIISAVLIVFSYFDDDKK